MLRPTRVISLVAIPLLLGVACHGDGDSSSNSDTSSTSSAVARPPLAVPANTILADTGGVLAPQGDGSTSVDDRGGLHQHIPIWVPPGRAGIQPDLSIDYASDGGNGMLGTGWALSGLSRITRCPGLRANGAIPPPVQWNDADSFCIDGEPLTPDTDRVYYYKFRFDGSRFRYTRASPSDPGSWEMRTKDGQIVTFGGTADSVLETSTMPAPMTWAVSRVQDRAGNFMTVSYETPTGGDLRPTRIDYTGSAASPTTKRSVTFTYETTTRPDVDQRMFAGQLLTSAYRLHSIDMHAPNSANKDPLRSFSFGYTNTTSPTTGRSLLQYIAECDGPAPTTLPVSGSVPLCRQQSFSYTPGTPVGAFGAFDGGTVTDSNNADIADIAQTGPQGVPPNVHLLDVDGDGRDDVLYEASDATYHLRLSMGNVFGPAILTGIPVATTSGLPQPQTGPSAPLVTDFNGDGHADVIVNEGETTPYYRPQVWLYLANDANGTWTLGGPGQQFQLFLPAPIYSDVQTADLDGNGRPDLVMSAGSKAYYTLNTDGTVNGLSPVAPLPLQDNADYNEDVGLTNYFMDFNNDGVTDLMTRLWSDDACRGLPIGRTNGAVLCDCKKLGFGAFDVAPHLYASGQPTQLTRVFGMKYCTTEDLGGDLPSYPRYGHLFGDFNGDGIVDVIETFTPTDPNGGTLPMQLTLLLGTGNQSFDAAAGGAFTIANPNVSFQTMDADGDGKTDLVARGYNASAPTLPYTIWSYKNRHWQAATVKNAEAPTANPTAFATGDVDGDGQSDLVALDGDGYLALYKRHPDSRADLLQSTSGDFTPATSVTYQPYRIGAGEDRSDCTLPLACVRRAGLLVSEVDVDNGLAGGTNAQSHAYAGGRFDVFGWGFLGFKQHTITDSASGAVTTRTFDFTRNTAGQTPFYPYLGHPTEVDTTLVYQSGTTNVTRTTTTTNQYEVRFLEYMRQFMVNPTSTRTETTDSNSPIVIDSRNITRTFDNYGNQTSERDQLPLVQEERNTTTTYLGDWNDWLLALPTYESTSSSTNVSILGGTTQTRETAYTYDANGQLAVQIDNPGAPDGSSYDPLPPQTDGVQTLYTRYTRDANGLPYIVEQLDNLTSPTVRRVTKYDRDPSEGMFVIEKTDPANLVTQAAYEPGLGVIAAQADAANVLTTFQYDGFGRIRADHPAAGGGRVIAYHAATSGNAGSIDEHRSGQYNTRKMLDSLRRTVQTITTGRLDGKAVYVETTYDALGRTATVSRPHFSGATPAQTTTSYDQLGRVTRVQGADGSVQTTSYLGRTATTTNPDGNVSAVTSDMLGRPVTSVQATTTGDSGLSGHVTTTTLKYGPFDTLISSTDTLGNVVTSTYDRMGRLFSKLDPDRGVTLHNYDVFGELSLETLGAHRIPVVFNGHLNWIIVGGTETDITYDGDGRMRTRTTPDMTQSFVYDSVMPGKLSSASITGGPTISYTYDSFGNVKTKEWAGPRGSIGYAYTYDSYNRLATTTYPRLSNGAKALVLRNTYSGGDIGGELTKVDDVTRSTPVSYWRLRSTDASEAFPVATLRNGVRVTLTEDPDHPSWLYTIVGTKGTTTEQSLRYTREGAGRVIEREDLVDPSHPITETFGYDGLERLTSWNWTGAAGTRGVSYIYDDLGNLSERNITAGPGTSVWYGYAGRGPHQVATDALGTAYAYDQQGNQLVAPGRSFGWNTFDRPISVTSAAGTDQLTYDPDLVRFSRTDPSGHTRYTYGGLFDEFTDAAGTHDVLTILAGGKPVGEKEITNNAVSSAKTNTLLTDALGSIDVIVTSAGRQAIKYDPFGARVTATDPTVRITAPPEGLRAGFTGHDHDDDVDLIDMIGRVYDPQTQRFLSVDPPAPDPVDSQAYNPYAYVRNNPLNATDPTGYLEVTLEGMYFGNQDGDTYGSAGYFDSVDPDAAGLAAAFGTSTGTTQGATGTDGTGTIPGTALIRPISVGTLQIDPGKVAPPAEANKNLVMAYFGLVRFLNASTGSLVRPSPGSISVAQIAGWTETLARNNLCGSCLSAALLNVELASWSGIDSQAYIVDVYFPKVSPGFPFPNFDYSQHHAVATMVQGGQRYFLTWGRAETASEFVDHMNQTKTALGAFAADLRSVKTHDETFDYWSGNESWLLAPAQCPPRPTSPDPNYDSTSNPYGYDRSMVDVRQVIHGYGY